MNERNLRFVKLLHCKLAQQTTNVSKIPGLQLFGCSRDLDLVEGVLAADVILTDNGMKRDTGSK